MALSVTSLYVLVIELTVWLMGARFLALLRTGPYVHPAELIAIFCILVLRRDHLRLDIPYRSIPIYLLSLSLIYQLLFVENAPIPVTKLLSSGFIVPLYEEVLYRVVLIDIVERRKFPTAVSVVACIITSALFFSIAHRNTVGSNEDMLMCVVSGLALAARYMASDKNLLEPWCIHVLHNLHVMLNNTSGSCQLTPITFYAIILLVSMRSLVSK